MQVETTHSVLVVGAGPAGLALALALLRNGISVRIIERDNVHHHGIRGPGITPRTLEIEHFMGVDEVLAVGLPSFFFHNFDPQDPHKVVRTVNIQQKQEPSTDRPIRAPVCIGQWKHQEILRKHIEDLGCYVELGTALVGIEQNADVVTAKLSKSGSDELETATFGYLVGADGGKSTVRHQVGLNLIGETREGKIYLADGNVEGLSFIHPGHQEAFMWGDVKKATALIRSTEEKGLFQMIFAGPEVHPDGLSEAGNVEAVQKELNRISGRDDIRVTNLTWQGEWRPNLRIASAFRAGRTFIVGDAAHTHSPTGGQGLNTSIQDSFNLAWKLALVLKNNCPPSLLDTYEQERLPVVAEMLDMTTKLLDETFSSQRFTQAFEKLKEESASTNGAFTRSAALHQLDVNYRWSPIVFDERISDAEKANAEKSAYGTAHQAVQAGDRAPEAPSLVCYHARPGLPTVSRLFDLFKPDKHVALIFASSDTVIGVTDVLAALDDIPACLRVVISHRGEQLDVPQPDVVDYAFEDSEGHAWEAYGAAEKVSGLDTVIVRPDAMVGAWVRSVGGIKSYAHALGLV